MAKKIFYVYGSNKVDARDDEVWKVKASTDEEALQWAKDKHSHRFFITMALTPAEARSRRDGWWSLLRNIAPREV